jgi:hypothetical protein
LSKGISIKSINTKNVPLYLSFINKEIDQDIESIPIQKWTVPNVAKWIDCKGYKDYSIYFRNNLIDGEALLLLNEDDLIKMGILEIGIVKKIFKLILNLKFINLNYFLLNLNKNVSYL